MICLLGKTASGKDTITNELVKNHGFRRIVTYTTRPMRGNERQDVEYHFVDEETFVGMIERGEFAEWKAYDATAGKWYYGVTVKDLESAGDKDLLIVTPAGYRDIIDALGYRPKSVYIYVNNATLRKRLAARGDDPKEKERRLLHDDNDFKHCEDLADKIYYNNEDDFMPVVRKIISFAEES